MDPWSDADGLDPDAITEFYTSCLGMRGTQARSAYIDKYVNDQWVAMITALPRGANRRPYFRARDRYIQQVCDGIGGLSKNALVSYRSSMHFTRVANGIKV